MPFLDGFLVGFAMVLFVGPVLFTLLQISLEKGFKSGFSAALGVFVSDIACVIICYIGADKFITNGVNDVWISILGLFILWGIGFAYIFKPNLNIGSVPKATKLSIAAAFIKGFLVNFVNPFVFGVWLAVIGIAKNKYTYDIDIYTYLFAATLAVLITDTIKVVFAHRLRKMLNPFTLKKIYRISGVLLVLFGIRLLFHIFSK